MTFTTITTEQRTADWHAARLGRITASRCKDLMTAGRGSAPSVTRQTYLEELAVERITGASQGFKGNEATSWGTEKEPEAAQAYEMLTGEMIEEVGFLKHPIFDAGASPDGLVNDDGQIEIKCPFNTGKHLRCFTDGMPKEHQYQIQFQLWITGREWCDFISYDPRPIDPRLRLYVQRIDRDPEMIKAIHEAVEQGCRDINLLVLRIMAAVDDEMRAYLEKNNDRLDAVVSEAQAAEPEQPKAKPKAKRKGSPKAEDGSEPILTAIDFANG